MKGKHLRKIELAKDPSRRDFLRKTAGFAAVIAGLSGFAVMENLPDKSENANGYGSSSYGGSGSKSKKTTEG